MDEFDLPKLTTPTEFDFPFPPYKIQQDFMKNLYETIENKKCGIFESPTGTGKSLSIICSVLKWLRDYTEHVKRELNNSIQKLEHEKLDFSESSDWLEAQVKEISITHKIAELRLRQNKILDYEKKVEDIVSKSIKKEQIKQYKKTIKTELTTEDNSQQADEEVEEEDLLLGESEANKDDSESEEETEDGFEPIKIYICSRTHSQLSQFVREILKSPYGTTTRTASLASRQNYCINPNVVKLKNSSLINEKCLDLKKSGDKPTKAAEGKVLKRKKEANCKCPYYKQGNIEELRNYALTNILDIEDLISGGKELTACPYYASRKAAEDAQIILVPYNTLLHKPTRIANGVKVKNNVVIIDEAHNLLDALSQMYGCQVSYHQLVQSRLQLKCYKERYSTRFNAFNLLCINQLIFVCSKIIGFIDKISKNVKNDEEIFTIQTFVITAEIDHFNMFKLVKFCKDSKIAQKFQKFIARFPCKDKDQPKAVQGLKALLSNIENKQKPKKNQNVAEDTEITIKPQMTTGNPLFPVISFLEALTYSFEDGRILFQKNADGNSSKLRFLVLNPAFHFEEIVKEARSVVVASGTMKPNSEFRDRLFLNIGIDPNNIVEFSCDHVIPPENILPIVLTKNQKGESLLFNYENRFKMSANLKDVIRDACQKVIGGVIVFFPSYSYESWFWNQTGDVFGRTVFREPQDSGSVENVLQAYAKAIKRSKRGALLFSVVGGKLSEGLNFSDDLGRCVIVVGLPYANIKSVELKEKMNYLDKTQGSGSGQKLYESLCFKAVNQCIGRAVRHRNDYAVVLLVDERYERSTSKDALPNWIKRSLKILSYKECFLNVEHFFKNKNSS